LLRLFRILSQIVRAAWGRRWRLSISLLAVTIGVWPLLAYAFLAGDYVHLGLAYPYCALNVSGAETGGSKPLSFSWGGVANIDRYLVCDASDNLASHIGKPDDRKEDGVAMRLTTRYLIGHFYLQEFSSD
jgi:nitrate reductase NapE component